MADTTQQVHAPVLRMEEDWVVVFLGFGIILLSILGVILPAPAFSWADGTDLSSRVLASQNILSILLQFLLAYATALLAAFLTGRPASGTARTFPLVYAVTLAALLLAGNNYIKGINLEAVIFSLAIGLFIRNFTNPPGWLTSSLNAELFVKIGLVLLGTTIVIGDILEAGLLGLIQALIVVVSVWYFAYWICKKLKVDDELTIMIASAVSICGVSAAIATAGAIKGDNKKLSYVISLVLVTAIPMMIVMPYVAKYFQFPEQVTGAWLGGTIDTTGAVVASGSLVGQTALKISTIVKFSQNVLLGIAAFAISIYWTYSSQPADTPNQKPTLKVIWQRFPKFVLGFVAASLLFSFAVSAETITAVKDSLKSIQTLWFVLAFTSIGLETRFSDLFNGSSKKPLVGFLSAQAFNILITLAIAYILFH